MITRLVYAEKKSQNALTFVSYRTMVLRKLTVMNSVYSVLYYVTFYQFYNNLTRYCQLLNLHDVKQNIRKGMVQ